MKIVHLRRDAPAGRGVRTSCASESARFLDDQVRQLLREEQLRALDAPDASRPRGLALPCSNGMPQVLSYRDWYRDGPFAAVPQAHRSLMLEAHRGLIPRVDRSIQAGPVQMINVSPPAGGVVEPPVPEYALHLLLDTAPLLRVGFNRRPRWLAVSPGAMLLAPPDTSCEYVADHAAHVLTIAIPKSIVEELTRDSGVRIEVRQEEAFRDPRLVRQLVRLWHELADEAPASQLFADQVMRALLATLARRTGGRPRVSSRHGREQLPNHMVRRLRDYVESSLADDLDVTMMADVAALSPAHFARAFAATVGMTPFRYVMSRRLARARELLERTHRSALDIALDVGFKTPSHFTSRFRQEFGVTPRAIRPDATRHHGLRPDAPEDSMLVRTCRSVPVQFADGTATIAIDAILDHEVIVVS